MTTDVTKDSNRTALWAGAVLLVIAISGCGTVLTFDGGSVVEENGTLNRTTRFICSDCPDSLKDNYELPVGGSWGVRIFQVKNSQGEEVEAKRQVYELLTEYPYPTAIPSDFVRKGSGDAKAHNEIRLITHNFYFVKTYHYEERFRDTATMEEFRKGARTLYNRWLDYAAKALEQELHNQVDAAVARRALTAVTVHHYENFVAGVQAHGLPYLNSDAAKKEMEDLENEEVFAANFAAILEEEEVSIDLDPAQWKESVKNALDFDTEDMMPKEKFSEIERSMFGVHGMSIFDSYSFAVRLTLPGRVYESNATRSEDDTLLWEFEHWVFVLQDYTLSARSRILYPLRLAVTAAVLSSLVLLGVVAYLRRRRKQGTL